jgi:hypothetical protein
MPFSLKRRSNAIAGDGGDKSEDVKRKSKRKSLLGLLKGERWRKKGKKGKGEEVSDARLKDITMFVANS